MVLVSVCCGYVVFVVVVFGFLVYEIGCVVSFCVW